MDGFEKTILSDINLDIHPGEFVAIGSRKTTLLNIIMGFLKPSSGAIVVTGSQNSFSPFDELERKKFSDIVGVLEQRPAVFRGTVGYNLTLISLITKGDYKNPSPKSSKRPLSSI